MFSEHEQRRKVRDVPGFVGMPVQLRCMAAESGAEMTMMETGSSPHVSRTATPVGAWFLLFKAKATNMGEDRSPMRRKAASTMASTLTRWGPACETT